jgi:hypothetical protein
MVVQVMVESEEKRGEDEGFVVCVYLGTDIFVYRDRGGWVWR